jgi:RimJ/RimL family protein N-acetyltransferase
MAALVCNVGAWLSESTALIVLTRGLGALGRSTQCIMGTSEVNEGSAGRRGQPTRPPSHRSRIDLCRVVLPSSATFSSWRARSPCRSRQLARWSSRPQSSRTARHLMKTLHTERLQLHLLCADDVERVTALAADPRVMTPLGGPRTALESRAWLDRQLAHIDKHGYGRYAVTCESEFVGCVGLLRDDFERGLVPGVEVAWHLAFDHWHRGYATEASRAVIDQGFTLFDLSEVIAVTSVDNARSRRVMDRLGMLYSPQEDFDHPLLPEGDPLRRHVVYRLRRH